MMNIVLDYFRGREQSPPKPKSNSKIIEYTVQPGDTLFGVSLMFEANMWMIKQLNSLSDDQDLVPGQIIKLELFQGQHQEEELKQQQPTEQRYGGAILRPQLLNTIIDVPLLYRTRNGDVEGNMKITYDTITFHPNREKLRKLLIKNLKRREHQITEAMLNEYEFFIKQREVYRTTYQNDQLTVYLWGVIGVDVPLYYDEEVSLIKVSFLTTKQTNQSLHQIKGLLDVSSDLKACQPMEIVAYMLYLISYDHLTVTEDSLNTTLLPFISFDLKPISCVTFIAFYELVPLKSVRDPSLERKKEPIMPKMIPDDSDIVTFGLMRNMVAVLPQYLSTKDWHLVYSTARHGTSFEEMMRRCEHVDAHLIFIRETDGAVFGAFVTESWRMSKDKFFGGGESFLFKLIGTDLQVFHSTQANQCYQMADEMGFSVGAGDRYGLWVNAELLKGNTYPCETFNNDKLHQEHDFKIKQLEIWCFRDDWQSTNAFYQVKRSLIHK